MQGKKSIAPDLIDCKTLITRGTCLALFWASHGAVAGAKGESKQ
jgi:hypothetical protein